MKLTPTLDEPLPLGSMPSAATNSSVALKRNTCWLPMASRSMPALRASSALIGVAVTLPLTESYALSGMVSSLGPPPSSSRSSVVLR